MIVLAAAALGALSLVGCDDRQSSDRDYDAAPPVEAPPATPEEDQDKAQTPPPVTDPAPTPPPERLEPENRTSEQSVQPESETLFY